MLPAQQLAQLVAIVAVFRDLNGHKQTGLDRAWVIAKEGPDAVTLERQAGLSSPDAIMLKWVFC